MVLIEPNRTYFTLLALAKEHELVASLVTEWWWWVCW